jgi:DNA-binding NarL/FixJ family response regulator
MSDQGSGMPSAAEAGMPASAAIRVLLVDDHAVVRGGLRALLGTTDDIEVVGEAPNGDEAVRQAASLTPDVVLMDLSMPGTDGVTATRRILAQNPDVHVVVLTSFSEQRWITDALEAGADGYLLKQSEPEVIIDGIREVVRGGAPLDPKAARVLLTSRRTASPAAASPLTDREAEVLDMVTQGHPNKVIARRLGISERTVKAHLTSIFARLGVADRTQAALWAQRNRPESDGSSSRY